MNRRHAKFPLGKIIGTPGALEALSEAGDEPATYLKRHVLGDWGEVDAQDKQANDWSVLHQARLLSAYRLSSGVKVWVITEADRTATTILLPSEY